MLRLAIGPSGACFTFTTEHGRDALPVIAYSGDVGEEAFLHLPEAVPGMGFGLLHHLQSFRQTDVPGLTISCDRYYKP